MAKYTETAGCGHTTTMQLYGPHKERQRRLEWMRSPSGMCNTCYAAAKRAEERALRETERAREDTAVAQMVQRGADMLAAQGDEERVVAVDKIRSTYASGHGSTIQRRALEIILATE